MDAISKASRVAQLAIQRISEARAMSKAFPYSTAIPFAHNSAEQDVQIRDMVREELGRKYGVPNVQVTIAGSGWLRVEVRE